MSSVQLMKLTSHFTFSLPAFFTPFFSAAMDYSPAAFSFSVFSPPRGDLALISSTVFERVSATWATSFRLSSAAKVALTTLCGLDVPMDFVSTLVIPQPASPAPAAGNHVGVFDAGFSSTCADSYQPVTW
jgi:hypothetical protein